MKTLLALLALWVGGMTCLAAGTNNVPMLEPIHGNFYNSDYQFTINTKVKNTPVIRVYFTEGTNEWVCTNCNVYLTYGKNESSTPYASITGVTSYVVVTNVINVTTNVTTNTYAEFYTTTNNFPYAMDKWYASILVASTNGLWYMSQIDGTLNVKLAPERTR